MKTFKKLRADIIHEIIMIAKRHRQGEVVFKELPKKAHEQLAKIEDYIQEREKSIFYSVKYYIGQNIDKMEDELIKNIEFLENIKNAKTHKNLS
jgi:hypothetical protein